MFGKNSRVTRDSSEDMFFKKKRPSQAALLEPFLNIEPGHQHYGKICYKTAGLIVVPMYSGNNLNPPSLTINSAYTFPTADGTANQYLQTNGAGDLAWSTVSSANFSNQDLIFTGNRTHNTAGYAYELTTDNGAYAQAYHNMYTGGNILGFNWSRLSITENLVSLGANTGSGSNLFQISNNTVGIGYNNLSAFTAGARVDIKAQGALSTDIVFRIRNSANTYNILNVTGNGAVWSNGKSGIATNTAYGELALTSITTGYSNEMFGRYTGGAIKSGYENVGMGYLAAQSMTSGYWNTFVGNQAGRFVTTAISNTAVGSFALQIYSAAYGFNTAIGNQALAQTNGTGEQGAYNTAIGYRAGFTMTTARYSFFAGFNAGSGITTGEGNTIIGSNLAPLAATTNNSVIIADGFGNISLRKDANNYVGFGYAVGDTLGAKVDIKAQGALSTDIAFRVRNSADTRTNFEVNGLGQVRSRTNSFYGDLAFISYVSDTGVERDAFRFSSYVQNFMGRAWTFDANTNGVIEGFRLFNDLTGNDQGVFTIQANNYCFGTSILAGEGAITERRVMRLVNGVAPTTNVPDGFKMYSADESVGNACFHTMSEDGREVKLYQKVSADLGNTINTGDANTDAAINAVLGIILNTGLGALA